jgi:hypothetical protein
MVTEEGEKLVTAFPSLQKKQKEGTERERERA